MSKASGICILIVIIGLSCFLFYSAVKFSTFDLNQSTSFEVIVAVMLIGFPLLIIIKKILATAKDVFVSKKGMLHFIFPVLSLITSIVVVSYMNSNDSELLPPDSFFKFLSQFITPEETGRNTGYNGFFFIIILFTFGNFHIVYGFSDFFLSDIPEYVESHLNNPRIKKLSLSTLILRFTGILGLLFGFYKWQTMMESQMYTSFFVLFCFLTSLTIIILDFCKLKNAPING
jgi:hypothetical protein